MKFGGEGKKGKRRDSEQLLAYLHVMNCDYSHVNFGVIYYFGDTSVHRMYKLHRTYKLHF